MDLGTKKKLQGLIDKVAPRIISAKVPYFVHLKGEGFSYGLLAAFQGKQPDFIVYAREDKIVVEQNGKELFTRKIKRVQNIQDSGTTASDPIL